MLEDVTLGIAAGDRIGVVGRNGDGKSTLLRLIAGAEEPDSGAVTRSGGLHVALLGQGDDLDRARRSARSSSAAAPTTSGWPTPPTAPCSTGCSAASRSAASRRGWTRRSRRCRAASGAGSLWRRRCSATPSCCCSTSRPTTSTSRASTGSRSHLAARRGSILVVTHDRWFLDAVCTHTWEVADTAVHQYEGGYAAYVLARAERREQAAAREERRQQLIRKELAWLRRGPPARTSKPKFRIEAANALIADEPEVRDRAELLRFATSRLGNKVLDAEHVSLAYGEKTLLRDATWRLGPGDRFALVGVNGSGKTSLMKLLAGELEPTTGVVERGATVKLAFLSQDTAEIPGHLRVLEAVEEIRGRAVLGDGRELTAGQLCERFGFGGEKGRTLVQRPLAAASAAGCS